MSESSSSKKAKTEPNAELVKLLLGEMRYNLNIDPSIEFDDLTCLLYDF